MEYNISVQITPEGKIDGVLKVDSQSTTMRFGRLALCLDDGITLEVGVGDQSVISIMMSLTPSHKMSKIDYYFMLRKCGTKEAWKCSTSSIDGAHTRHNIQRELSRRCCLYEMQCLEVLWQL